MNKEVIAKKRKALRCQITQLINAAEQQLNEAASREQLLATQAQIKGIRESLKSANEQMEKYLTEETADAEFERVIEYDMKITAILSTIEFRIREPVQMELNSSARQAVAPSTTQDATELVKLPKLEMIKFGGRALEWHRFWAQYESAVHLRPNMTKGQKFNYL